MKFIMSALHSFIRKINLTQMNVPEVLIIGQGLAKKVAPQDVAAAARWGGVVGLTAFWFIEPYDWIRSLREGDPDAK